MPLYAISAALYFWLPTVVIMTLLNRRLTRPQRDAFWIACLIIGVMSIGMEYLCLWLDIWNFSTLRNPLLGIAFVGAPIEEFEFWLGAAPFILAVYFLIRALRGELAPRSVIAARRGGRRHARA
jgi:lycopene cyclase domain-containing protein